MQASRNTANGLSHEPAVEAAEHEVARRKSELAKSLKAAGKSGERLANRVGEQLKPALIAGAVVVGAVAVVSVAVAVTRRRRSFWQPPARPSAFGAIARGAGLWLLRIAAKRVAEEVAARLAEPAAPAAVAAGAPRSVAPSPNQI